MDISKNEYKLLQNLVYDKFGIDLGEEKQSLVVGRLQKVVHTNGFQNFHDYYKYVLNDNSGQGLNTLINKISTNHTYFYREKDHFEFFLDQVLPEIAESSSVKREKHIRIWCAGCSYGEESYTLAMLLLDFMSIKKLGYRAGVLATDISEKALKRAQKGIYSDENVRRMPPALKNKHFTKTPDKNWKVKDPVKNLVLHRRLNFMRNTFPFKRKFSCIFCRNVMIYFDQPTRDRLVAGFAKYIEPGSYFFIGHSESLGRTNPYFEYVRPAVYRRIGVMV